MRQRRPLWQSFVTEQRSSAPRDYSAILQQIADEVRPLVGTGKVAAYIPRLAEVPPDRFGIAIATLDGKIYRAGSAREAFSVQSISKVFTLTLALEAVGARLWERVGREPSGNAFNSLIQLEREQGIPRNPLINAGALVVADVLLGALPHGLDDLLSFVRARSGNHSINIDAEVAASERDAGFRNAALANFIRSFGNLQHPVDDVLNFYFHQCALAMDCVDLARTFLHLANRGYCPGSRMPVITEERARRINALMMTCGTYDAAGEFAFRVGLPAKSGVGGGIVAVVPDVLTLAVWSPGLDERGNSLAGAAALARFVELTGLSVF